MSGEPKWPIMVKHEVGATPVSGAFAAWLAANQAAWERPRSGRPGTTWLVSSGRERITIHGFRRLQSVVQEGYGIRGRVSLGGKAVTVIDSSELFELPNGDLIKVPLLHVTPR